jgi:hypothetical protein
MVQKYTATVSATKIMDRIKGLLGRGVPVPLKKEWVIKGFGGILWNLRESDAIDFDSGFDYLNRYRAIKFIDTETFNLTPYFETLSPGYHAPPPFPIQIDRQISKEAEIVQHCHYWLYVFENTMRNFIQESLSEKYGKDWHDKLTERVKGEIEKNKKRWYSEIPPRNPLEFTELPSLGSIIMNEWQNVFGDKFENTNPTSLEEALKSIERFRNSVAHSRMLSEGESTMFFHEITRVLSSIKISRE